MQFPLKELIESSSLSRFTMKISFGNFFKSFDDGQYTVSISKKKIVVNGETIVESVNDGVKVEVEGSIVNLNSAGETTIKGDVKGDVDVTGDCWCQNVGGNVDITGNLECGNVNGDVDSVGNISMKR